MNVQVIGWYGHHNIGDEAYKLAFPMLFSGHNLIFSECFTPDNHTDVVLFGGGDIVYPFFTKQLAKCSRNIRKVLMSVSLMANSDLDALGYFDCRFFRDKQSNQLSHDYGYYSDYLPDVTFILQPDIKAGKDTLEKLFQSHGKKPKEKVVVVVFSSYLTYLWRTSYARDLTTFLKVSQDISFVADEMEDVSFVFMPFSTLEPNDDRTSNAVLAARCDKYGKNLMLWNPMSPVDAINVIGAADAVVSTRLHASIFATISGTPFIDITHHDKNGNFLKTLNKEDWSIPYWEFNYFNFKSLLNSHLLSGEKNESLLEFTENARRELRDVSIF